MKWGPHVVYELVGVKRQTLVYWRKHIYPQKAQKLFSTYEILLFSIIKICAIHYGIRIDRLGKIKWVSVLKELQGLTFLGYKGVVLRVDVKNCSYDIFEAINDLPDTVDTDNIISIDIEAISNDLTNKILGVKLY